ncbi:MAG: DUF3536 domain-containing protein, partial [Ktedonobacterales bacterium]
FSVTSLGRYLRDHTPQREITLRTPSAWSCSHAVRRWSEGCSCTEGDSSWKPALRHAFDQLAVHLHDVFERATAGVLHDPWAARDSYLSRYVGWQSEDEFWQRFGANDGRPLSSAAQQSAERLLEAEYFGQCMYTSCGFFFEDLDRIEPRNDIAFARRAISLVWQATGVDLEAEFVRDLAAARSWCTALTGADLYRQLPPVGATLLPGTANGAQAASAA